MGAWGAGLYSSDFAMDLRPLISAIVRLPLPDSELARIAIEANPTVANDTTDEDYTIFWLTLADQFAKKGVDCPRTRQCALDIIASGSDIAMMRQLGMQERDLRKRQNNLDALRSTITSAAAGPAKPRKTLKEPQRLIMQTGDCFVYPVCKKQAINPYFASADLYGWIQDGWGAALVVETGRTLDYLVWYRLAALEQNFTDKPSMGDVRRARIAGGLSAGTCSPTHFKRMRLEKIGALTLRPGAIHGRVPELATARSGDMAAIHDISVSNNLSINLFPGAAFEGPLVAELM